MSISLEFVLRHNSDPVYIFFMRAITLAPLCTLYLGLKVFHEEKPLAVRNKWVVSMRVIDAAFIIARRKTLKKIYILLSRKVLHCIHFFVV